MKSKLDLKDYIETIPGFPKEGILFRDITPLMLNHEAYRQSVDEMVEFGKKLGAEVVVGPEARGFIFGCPVAMDLKIGFAPVRKPGKLPRDTVSASYDLEYGSNELSLHQDAVKPGQKVLIVDDLLATGGTLYATIDLIRQLGGEVVGCAFLIELTEFSPHEKIKDIPVLSLIKY